MHARHRRRLGQQRRPRLPAAGRDRRPGEVVDRPSAGPGTSSATAAPAPGAPEKRRRRRTGAPAAASSFSDSITWRLQRQRGSGSSWIRWRMPTSSGSSAHAAAPAAVAAGVEQGLPADDAGDPVVLARVREHRGGVLAVVLGLYEYGRVDAARDQLVQQLGRARSCGWPAPAARPASDIRRLRSPRRADARRFSPPLSPPCFRGPADVAQTTAERQRNTRQSFV